MPQALLCSFQSRGCKHMLMNQALVLQDKLMQSPAAVVL